jgi:hypothetical protein
MESSRKLTKLDFRFAGPDDAPELVEFINDSQACEREGDNAFRNESLVTEERIESECNSMSTRWVVLETPVPEEDIVAAAKFNLSSDGAVVGFIGAFKDAQSTPIEKMLLARLLAKIESVVIGHGMPLLTVEVFQWQEKLMDWLSSCGYEEMGGYLSNDGSLLRPAMVLTYKKSLLTSPNEYAADERRPARISHESAVEAMATEHSCASDEVVGADFDFSIIDTGAFPGTTAGGGGMENLIVDLFRALHHENA